VVLAAALRNAGAWSMSRLKHQRQLGKIAVVTRGRAKKKMRQHDLLRAGNWY